MRRVYDQKLMLDATYLLPLFGIDVPLQCYSEIFPKSP
jgi:hypothetical protein